MKKLLDVLCDVFGATVLIACIVICLAVVALIVWLALHITTATVAS